MSITPETLKNISIEQVAGSDIVLVTDLREVYKYENNKRTDTVDGYRYAVVAPDNKYEQFSIKTAKAFITPEQLAAAKGGVIKVRVKGFKGRFYRSRDTRDTRDTRDYLFTSTAEALEIIPIP